ncbi:MAG: hypothetical protein ACTSWW_02725 [Promethearchaeota archaeon]
MTVISSSLHRSYRIGTTPVIPRELYADLEAEVHRHARYTLSGLINQTFGNYVENQSRIVRSICENFGKTLPRHSPSPKQHYGNFRHLTKTSANIADSAHAYLAWSYSQFLTQLEKFRDFLSYLDNPTFTYISHTWLVSGFIPRWVAKRLASRWRINDWTWVSNIARGWRNTIEKHSTWPTSLGSRKTMNQFSPHEWSHAGIALLEAYDSIISQRVLQGLPTQKLAVLWRKIAQILRSGLDYLSSIEINGLSATQKVHANGLRDHCGKRNYRSALGLLYAELMIQRLGTAQVSLLLGQLQTNAENLLTSPFSSTHGNSRLPAIILTSPKYILTRLNGGEMSTEIHAGHPVFFTLPRRPTTATALLSSYHHLLTPIHRDRLRDEFPKLPERNEREIADRGSHHRDRHFRIFLRRLLGLRLKRWLGMKLSPQEQKWITKIDPIWEKPLKAQKLALELTLHPKVRDKIQKGAVINQILIHPPRTAAKHTTAVLQLSGTRMQLISSPQISTPRVSPSRVYVLGYDLNRLSKHAVTFGALDKQRKQIPLKSLPRSKMKQVEQINRGLKAVDLHVSHMQQALHRYGSDAKRAGKLAFELRLLHRRRKNLKHEAEMLITQEVYAQIKYYSPQIVAYENLRGMSTRGKRGTLAKIVTYMYKRSDALATRINEWHSIQTHAPLLTPVNPRNTSKIHFDCGGVIQRTIQKWDRAPCNRCGKMVNTQLNAPLRIAAKAFPS